MPFGVIKGEDMFPKRITAEMIVSFPSNYWWHKNNMVYYKDVFCYIIVLYQDFLNLTTYS